MDCNYLINQLKYNVDFSAIKDLIISLGVIFGGLWTYLLFIKNRQIYPRANISHEIFHINLPNKRIFLRVKTVITNIGNVLISLDSGFTRVSQILPVCREAAECIENYKIENKRHEIEWPMIDKKEMSKNKCEIEPGERDELIFDFLLADDLEQIMVYSYFANTQKKQKKFSCQRDREIGWPITTICNLKGG